MWFDAVGLIIPGFLTLCSNIPVDREKHWNCNNQKIWNELKHVNVIFTARRFTMPDTTTTTSRPRTSAFATGDNHVWSKHFSELMDLKQA